MIPYGKQSIDDRDIAAIVETLKSDFLTGGPAIEQFEKAFAEFVGAKHAVVVCNATAALHLAMLIAKIGPGDRVITSPNTFLSSANCAAFVGATPDFCDIDAQTYNMSASALDVAWTDDIKAVIPVAYAGQSADLPAIAKIAHQRGAIVIEDASHATGGGFQINGQSYRQGGNPWADMTIFSFHPVKTLTTGEGGMLVTDNAEWASKARQLRSHGVTRDNSAFVGLSEPSSTEYSNDEAAIPSALTEQGPWYYEMQDLGYNYRITDLQCALGLSQLNKLPSFIQRRREIVAQYNEAFADLNYLKTPSLLRPEDQNEISWHLYTVRIDFSKLGKTRSQVMQELREKGIGSQVLYIPVHLQPWYRETYGYGCGKCPEAEANYKETLSLPLYPAMSEKDTNSVIMNVKSALSY